jgi:hypothetical protein
MAEDSTTDSTQTTQTTDPATQTTGSSDTSTTVQPQSETTQDEAPAEGETLLTGADPAQSDDKPEDKVEDKDGDDKDGDDKPDPNAELFGAPETYEITGLPEGMEIDKAALEAVTPLAKDLNLSNAGLSKLASVYAEKVLPGVTERMQDQLQQDIAAQHSTWANEAVELVKTDPAFEGKPLKEVQQVSAKTLDRFFDPEFRQFLNDTGLGNHPQMLKGMYLVGTKIAEDTTFERGSTVPPAKSRTEKFYGPQQS